MEQLITFDGNQLDNAPSNGLSHFLLVFTIACFLEVESLNKAIRGTLALGFGLHLFFKIILN